MRGGFLHNHVLLDPVERYFRGLGADVQREYPVAFGKTKAFVDLFIRYRRERIVCEAELSSDRARKDLAKAIELRATFLLIVVPDWPMARAVKRRLSRVGHTSSTEGLRSFILPLGPALQWVRNCFPFLTSVNSPSDIKSPREPQGRASDGR